MTAGAGVVAEADADARLEGVLARALEANGRWEQLAAEPRAENERLRARDAQREAELGRVNAALAVLQWMVGGRSSERARPEAAGGDSAGGDGAGPNLFWTTKANSFPGVPTLSFTTGHVTFMVDSSGKTTEYQLAGNQTDVYAVLATP